MGSSRMLRSVTLVRTEVLEELSASIFMVTRIGELITLALTSNGLTQRASVANYGQRSNSPILATLMMEALLLRNVGSYKNHTA
jgi:hypothetical protein